MFYSQFILAKKGPLGTIWIAAHLERKLRKNQVTETNIGVSVDSILFPEVPIALRLSGHLLLGVVRIYSRKVNYLFHDCSEALVKIKQAFHAGAVDLPPEAATAPFHSITLPETFDLDEFEPLLDRELNLLHSNGGVDHHVSSREQITLQDPLEDNSYLGSQFELDERFPEADAPRLGLDFDEDLLDKGTRGTSPGATLEEEEELPLEEDVIPPTAMDSTLDYDQIDRMDALDMDDDHQEPATPGLDIDHMDLEYQQQEDEGLGFDQPHRDPLEQLEPHFPLDNDELDNLQVGEKPATPRSPGPEVEPAPMNDEDKEPRDEQMEEERVEHEEERDEGDKQAEEEILEKVSEEETLNREVEEEIFGKNMEEETFDKEVEEETFDKPVEEETFNKDVEEETFNKEVEEETFNEEVGEETFNKEVGEEIFNKEVEEKTLDRVVEEEVLDRDLEQVTFEKQGDEEEHVAEEHEIRAEEQQLVREGFQDDKELEEKEEDQGEIPEYETVMSAPEATNQEPDVFGMDHDMQPEQVAAMDYQDRDVVMEDRDPVLVEEAIPVLHEVVPQAGMADPESPRYPPPINSDEIPGDNDVLATLLGRGTPALTVQQTPVETVAVKPRKRQNLRKRKVFIDTTTILGAEVMKQQLMNTDDIRRIRRKAPCTRQELWSVQKDTLSQQVFNEPSVPGLCGELRRLFEQVYVVGEATLPLATATEAEVFASEEVPGPPVPVVEDLNTDLNILADPPAEVAVAEEEVHVPSNEHQQLDVPLDAVPEGSRYVSTEATAAEGSLHLSPEAIVPEYRNAASPTTAMGEPAPSSPLKVPTTAMGEPAPSSPLKEAETEVVDTEVRAVDLNDEIVDMTEGMDLTLEYHPPVVGTEENPREEKESLGFRVEEEVNAPQLVDFAAEATIGPVAETEVEGNIAPIPHVHAEAEPDVESGSKVEIEFETGTQMLPEFDTGTQIVPEFGTGTQIVPEFETGTQMIPGFETGTQMVSEFETGTETVPEFETGTETVPEFETGTETVPKFETGTEMVPQLQAGTQMVGETESGTQIVGEFETGTQILSEAEAVRDLQGGVEPLEALQGGEFQETKVQEEEPIAVIPEEDAERKLAIPTPVVEVEIPEEQPDDVELGFLADTRDTEFLGADDDDLVEEAEDFQDAKDPGRKESMPQDNSGWSARTRAVGHYLRVTLEDKAVYMKRREEEGTAKLGLERMLVGKTRKEAARMFFETLVLKTKDYIHVEQDDPYGDIQISARPKLLKAKF